MIKIRKPNIRLFGLFLLFWGTMAVNAQESGELLNGKVSYVTGENIYVRFASTNQIENGDTLFIRDKNGLTPALLVDNKSSISCLCSVLGEHTFKVDDIVFGRTNKPVREVVQQQQDLPEKDVNERVLISQEPTKEPTRTQDINGRLSLSSYSNISDEADNIHRFRYTLSAKASHLSGSKISAETYVSFTHKLNQWEVVQENLNNALKVYSLALKYDINESATFWAGRKINPRIANVGAIDGVQFEYKFKNMFAGIVGGTRPDHQDYGYNFDLFEYGAYVGQSKKTSNGFVQSSLAFFEQRNSGNIDRRFVYMQHTNSAIKNLTLFSSMELDLYKVENEKPTNTVSLTGLYFSARYRFSKRLSVFGSYDNRKNVIYYETFRNYADEILQQASRQGVRARINYRPVNGFIVGASAGTRFRDEGPRPTKTLNGFATWTKVPALNASLSITANLMQTSYLDGQVYGARLSKDLVSGKLYTMLHYRWVDFQYVNTLTNLQQHIGELDLSWQFSKKLYLSANYEATFQDQQLFNRLYLNLRIKF
ncbi:TonB-dependent receptor [Draconibacterium sediminis]|uniref:Outer membrane protein beta-barrel domain-containing protein n=1 Tax=Draconibacterium sediminis TaxID=1544798 RepID=A0A0D8JCU5_9BACT|nr:hypothetical protein [Draconibacterium sediminis]KJF44747.1 hypothetical protein LH29_04675 [Draconibacterium sediminis]